MSTITTSETQNPPSTPVAAESKLFGILSLVSSGFAIVTGPLFIFAVAAVVLGIIGLRREPAGRTLSIWGIVVGSAMIVLPLLVVLGFFALAAPVMLWSGAVGH